MGSKTKRLFVLAALVTLPAVAAAQSVQAPSVQPPTTATLLARYRASGIQIYGCSMTQGGAWTLTAPDAELYDAGGVAVIHHSAGPTWQGRDGARVTGKLLAKAPSPVADTIPWLLLEATSSGQGALAGTRYVVRRDTKGGVAPSGPCGAGAVARVPYEAVYEFYR